MPATGLREPQNVVTQESEDMPAMLEVTKAVFPVAGLGTRFLPATKASPKEMLPIVDKPLIQYAVEEAIEAGITELIFVTGRGKRAIEDHFDKSYEIEAELEARNKTQLLDMVRNIKPANVDCFYVRQATALGLGHAVLCAEKLVGDSPFAVILADDLLYAPQPVTKQLVGVFNHYHSSVVGVETIERAQSASYGVVDGRLWGDNVIKLSGIVEKPAPADAPSNFGVVGRYVLMPTIFEHIRALRPAARRRRTAADRRAAIAAGRGAGAGLPLCRRALRLRQQARLSEGHRGIRAAPSRGAGRFRGLSATLPAGPGRRRGVLRRGAAARRGAPVRSRSELDSRPDPAAVAGHAVLYARPCHGKLNG